MNLIRGLQTEVTLSLWGVRDVTPECLCKISPKQNWSVFTDNFTIISIKYASLDELRIPHELHQPAGKRSKQLYYKEDFVSFYGDVCKKDYISQLSGEPRGRTTGHVPTCFVRLARNGRNVFLGAEGYGDKLRSLRGNIFTKFRVMWWILYSVMKSVNFKQFDCRTQRIDSNTSKRGYYLCVHWQTDEQRVSFCLHSFK